MPSSDPTRDPTQEDLLYLAGMFDGEGCVTVLRNNNHLQVSKVGRNRTATTEEASWFPRVSVKMTHADAVQRFGDCFGGQVKLYRSNNVKHKDQWRWDLWRKDQILHFANTLAEHTVVKRPQLEALLLWYSMPIRRRGRGSTLSPEETRIRRLCYNKIRQSNKGMWDNLKHIGHGIHADL